MDEVRVEAEGPLREMERKDIEAWDKLGWERGNF